LAYHGYIGYNKDCDDGDVSEGVEIADSCNPIKEKVDYKDLERPFPCVIEEGW